MGIIYVKRPDFELKIEDNLFSMKDSNSTYPELSPWIAKLIDDLTEKFIDIDNIKKKKLLE